MHPLLFFFFFQAEDGIRDYKVTGVQTCALPISREGLGLTQVGAADGADLHAGQASQHREVGALSDRARADHRHADRVAHFGVPGLLSREPAQWYITPLRSDAVDTPLDRTPRASSVNRQRLEIGRASCRERV